MTNYFTTFQQQLTFKVALIFVKKTATMKKVLPKVIVLDSGTLNRSSYLSVLPIHCIKFPGALGALQLRLMFLQLTMEPCQRTKSRESFPVFSSVFPQGEVNKFREFSPNSSSRMLARLEPWCHGLD